MLGHGNTISNNVIHDCDYQAYDDAGIYAWGGNDTISNNTVYNCGRDGIKVSGATSTNVLHNLVHNVMLQTTDGGGIYAYGTDGSGSQWAYNEIYNVSAGGSGAGGLYLDNNDHGYSIHNNDVFNCQIAFKINPSSLNEKIISNTLLASEFSIEGSGSRNMSGSQLIDNVFNKPVQVAGSVVMSGNVSSGDTSNVTFAGASISASTPIPAVTPTPTPTVTPAIATPNPTPTPTPTPKTTLNAVSAAFSAVHGAMLDYYIGTFIDSNALDTAASGFTATVNWGDGTAASTGVVAYNASTKHFNVTGSHKFAAKGTYRVTIAILGPGGSKTTIFSTSSVS